MPANVRVGLTRFFDRALPKRGEPSFLAPPVACVDLHPPRPQERLGLGLQHLDRAVGGDIQQQHVPMADAGRNPQTHPALALVLESTSEHRAELMEDWDLCNRLQTPKKIAPLS
jgi:hypothetical protein